MSATGGYQSGLPRIAGSAALLGAVGLVTGYIAPLELNPWSNLGPITGIFFTGPGGVVAGLVLGIVAHHFAWGRARFYGGVEDGRSPREAPVEDGLQRPVIRDSPFAWLSPELPEDLFFGSHDQLAFASVTHEGDAWILKRKYARLVGQDITLTRERLDARDHQLVKGVGIR